MFNAPPDPVLVSLSTIVYRILLSFYPPRFKREFGQHMAQVFRDCCLKVYRQSGPPGMLSLWALTLFDWLKTVIEEQTQRGTEMTRSKFIRLSGWALMLGPVSLYIGLGDTAQYRSLLDSLLGAPADQSKINAFRFVSETIPLLLLFLGLGLILLGFLGLDIHYREKVGRLGRLSLRLILFCACASFAGGLCAVFDIEVGWFFFLIGFFSSQIFLGIFGLASLREKPLPRWNALPLFTGAWFPVGLGIGIALGWDEHPYFLVFPMTFVLLGLGLLGYVLQVDASRKEAATG